MFPGGVVGQRAVLSTPGPEVSAVLLVRGSTEGPGGLGENTRESGVSPKLTVTFFPQGKPGYAGFPVSTFASEVHACPLTPWPWGRARAVLWVCTGQQYKLGWGQSLSLRT